MILDDVTVLDLTQLLPGPLCTQLLADFGAKVTKIEGPEGDSSRAMGSKVSRESGPFMMLNRNKRSIVLDLKTEKARDVFFRLATTADVVIEGFRPGVVDRLGIGYKEVSQVNERIIYCSLSGYGQTGPYRDRPGHDLNYIALGGILGATGFYGSKPAIPGGQIADITGALLAAIGVMLALLAREKTKRGQYVDVGMMDGVMAWLPIILGEYLATGSGPKPGQELINGGYACYNVYLTRDGSYMSLGALEPHFWATFCNEVGQETLIFKQFAEKETQREMIAKLGTIFGERTQAQWVERFQGKNIPCEPVLTLEQVLAHPQVLARDMISEVNHPLEGRIQQLGIPIKLSATPGEIKTPSPLLGEHTDMILREIGMSVEEIDKLATEGVVRRSQKP